MPENLVMLEIPVVTQENLANTIACMNIHQRIKRKREALGLSMQALAALVEVKAWQTIQQWEKEGGTAPKRDRLEAVATALKTTPEYLLFGDASESQPDLVSSTIADSYDPIPVNGWKAIPVMGRAQLGDNGHFSEMQMQEGGEGYIDFPSRDPDVYAVKCVGESMKPRIQNGEFAVIEPHHGYDPGDDVLVIAQDERVMIKRFLYKRAGQTHLISVNEAHPPIVLDDVQIKKIHFVRAICRPSVWRETP